MRVLGHGGLIDSFKKAAALSFLSMTAGCVTIPWDGNPGHGEDRIHEPLLTPQVLGKDDIIISNAPQTISGGTFIKIDNLLHANDKFTVRQIDFPGSAGDRSKAYLTLPEGEGPHPLVVVFPVLNQDHSISEVLSKEMARGGYAVLRVEGYYLNLAEIDSAKGVMDRFRHTILDARALMNFVVDLPEIDSARIGVTGISLGGIMSATMMGIEEDIGAGAFMLAGGGLPEILYDSQQDTIISFRETLFDAGAVLLTGGLVLLEEVAAASATEESGRPDISINDLRQRIMDAHSITTREEFLAFMEPYTYALDPSRYAGSLHPCRTMVLSAMMDDVIPEERTKELWERLGKPEWNKVLAGHSRTFALYFYWATERTLNHLDRVLRNDVCYAPDLQQEQQEQNTDIDGTIVPVPSPVLP